MNAPIDLFPQSSFTASYQTHRNLPPLAGLCSFVDAVRPGLSVDQSVRRLKRHHYVLRRIHGILTARITAEPIYELKMAWSHQAWLCAEQVSALRARVGEMREPPLGLDKVPHEGLALVFDELQAAPRDLLLLGLYEIVLPALLCTMADHAAEAHPLADQPTVRLLRIAQLDLDALHQYGRKAISSLVSGDDRAAAQPALSLLRQAIAAAGGLDGTRRPVRMRPCRRACIPRSPGSMIHGLNGMNASLIPTTWESMQRYFFTIQSNQPRPRC